jgi:hypothetical protein
LIATCQLVIRSSVVVVKSTGFHPDIRTGTLARGACDVLRMHACKWRTAAHTDIEEDIAYLEMSAVGLLAKLRAVGLIYVTNGALSAGDIAAARKLIR